MNPPSSRLGVTIPTYKRPDQLLRCVRSVIRAAAPHHVPIYLLDDSTDDTNSAVVAQLQALYPHVIHQRNPANLGIDRNILHAVDACDTEYAWLLGEDDRMHPHAIATVLRALDEHPTPFLYANYSAVDNDLRFLIKERSLPLTTLTTLSADDFYRAHAWSAGFIGACVIRRADWLAVDPTPYLGTYFAHVGRIMEMIRGKSVVLLPDPLVLNRCGSPEIFTWTGDADNVLHGWGRMTRALAPLYGDKAGQDADQAFRRAHGMGTLKFYAYLRADGVFTPALRRQLLSHGLHSPAHTLAAFLISHTPPTLFRAARSLLMALRRRHSPPLDPETTG